jgi:hypothetical protein
MLTELFKYLVCLFYPKSGSCDITIVRRDRSATGRIGEIYLDGKYVGMSCDAFGTDEELIKLPVSLGFKGGKRVLRTDLYLISRGDFTARIDYNKCMLGSQDPKENDSVLSNLISRLSKKEYIRLTVLNRYLIPLRGEK